MEECLVKLDDASASVPELKQQLSKLKEATEKELEILRALSTENEKRLKKMGEKPEEYLGSLSIESIQSSVLKEIMPILTELSKRQALHEEVLSDKIIMHQHKQTILESEHSRALLLFYQTMQLELTQCFIGCKSCCSNFVKEQVNI